MKKKFYYLVMLLMTQCAISFADNTDISVYENVIYIEPFSVEVGTQTTISFKMKNSAEIRSFQFDLVLPEGITAVKNNAGNPRGLLNNDRVPVDEDGIRSHRLTLSEHEGGVIRFLCDAEYGETFIGNEGVIATLKVNVSETMAVGEYPIVMRNVKLSETDISHCYLTDYIESTVTVTEPGDGRTLLDENSTTAPAAAAGVDVRVRRTISADVWSTICLPFAMSEVQVKAAFGNDVKLADFKGYEVTKDGENIVGITVNFEDVNVIEANHPYIINVSKPVSEFTVDGVDINPSDPTHAVVERTSEQWSEMKGTYTSNFVVPNQKLFLNGNQFWYSTGATKMKAYRAYFDFYDVLTEVENPSTNVKMSIGGEETRIDGLLLETSNDAIYDLTGRKVEKAEKGIYIVNGKKVLVK